MKWLSGGLTFVNFTTLCGLLLGMVASGLGKGTAILSVFLGVAIAIWAGVTTRDPERLEASGEKDTNGAQRSYKGIWLWLVGVCFLMFAIRSFCWLLYIDSDQLKIQSPNNLGDLALHITYIRNFASGVALWPRIPSIFLVRCVIPPVSISSTVCFYLSESDFVTV